MVTRHPHAQVRARVAKAIAAIGEIMPDGVTIASSSNGRLTNRIVEAAGLSENVVRSALRRMDDEGDIHRVVRGRRFYEVIVVASDLISTDLPADLDAAGTENNSQAAIPGVQRPSVDPETQVPESESPGAPDSPAPSLGPIADDLTVLPAELREIAESLGAVGQNVAHFVDNFIYLEAENRRLGNELVDARTEIERLDTERENAEAEIGRLLNEWDQVRNQISQLAESLAGKQ